MAQLELAQFAAQAPAAPRSKGLFHQWEKRLNRKNFALLVLGFYVVLDLLEYKLPRAAGLAMCFCVLGGRKVTELDRAMWLGFTLTFVVGLYFGWAPFCHFLVEEVILKPLRDLFSNMEKDPQLVAAVIVSIGVFGALLVSFALGGVFSRKVGDVLSRLLQAEAEIEDEFEEHAPDLFLSLSSMLLFFENYLRFSRGD